MYMYPHLELDGWVYDLQQQLLTGSFTNRGKLQRQLVTLERIRDRLFEGVVEQEIKYSRLNNTRCAHIQKYCSKRFVPPGPHPKQPKKQRGVK